MVVFVRAVLHGHAPINATPLSGRSLPWRILILKGQSQRPKHHPKRFRFEPQQKSIAVYKPPKTTRSIYMVFEFQFIGHMVLEFPRLRPNPMIPWHLQRQSLPRSQKVLMIQELSSCTFLFPPLSNQKHTAPLGSEATPEELQSAGLPSGTNVQR